VANRELFDLVLIRRVDNHRFPARRIYVDLDNHKHLAIHMRGIAVVEDKQNRDRDNWLSHYEAALYKPGKNKPDEPVTLVAVLGEEEEKN
jgi:hypothetical protein